MDASSNRPAVLVARAADAVSTIPRADRTCNTATPAAFTISGSAAAQCGAFVCSTTQSGIAISITE